MLHSVAHATLSLRCIKVSREKSCNEQILFEGITSVIVRMQSEDEAVANRRLRALSLAMLVMRPARLLAELVANIQHLAPQPALWVLHLCPVSCTLRLLAVREAQLMVPLAVAELSLWPVVLDACSSCNYASQVKSISNQLH